MDKQTARRVAIKCFVYACGRGYANAHRRTEWLCRGLRLWQDATGDDMTAEIASVRRESMVSGQFMRDFVAERERNRRAYNRRGV